MKFSTVLGSFAVAALEVSNVAAMPAEPFTQDLATRQPSEQDSASTELTKRRDIPGWAQWCCFTYTIDNKNPVHFWTVWAEQPTYDVSASGCTIRMGLNKRPDHGGCSTWSADVQPGCSAGPIQVWYASLPDCGNIPKPTSI